jgi:superfamily II DNA or RNA helicase
LFPVNVKLNLPTLARCGIYTASIYKRKRKMIQLRPYQQELKNSIYSAWNEGHRNVLAVCPTGGGKSVIVSDIVLDGFKTGLSQAVIAHRNELVSQMSMHIARRGIAHRVIASNTTISQIVRQHREEFKKSFINPTSHTAVIGVDTLMARKDDLQPWCSQVHRWIMDECFVAGTLIKTPTGSKKIENVNVGDEVIAFNEELNIFENRQVTKKFQNSLHDIMIKIVINGSVLYSTLGHPFYTKRGWVKAVDLRDDDDLLFYVQPVQNKFLFRKRTSKLSFQKNWKCFLHKILRNDLSRCSTQTQSEKGSETEKLCGLFKRIFFKTCKNMQFNLSKSHIFCHNEKNKSEICCKFFGKNEEKQSNEKRRSEETFFDKIERNETQTTCQRWEWSTDSKSGNDVKNAFRTFRFLRTISNKNWNEAWIWLSFMLQTRHGSPGIKNINRSRWKLSQFADSKSARFEKRQFSKFVRLESLEIFKSTNHEKFLGSSVFNIEVDGCHTYIANNVVVHNCHHALKQNKWGTAATMFSNAYGLGVTATPCRADGQGLGAEFDGVANAMVIGPSMRELINLKALSDYEIVCPDSDLIVTEEDIGESGDYSHKKLKSAAKKSHIVGDVVENYIKYAANRRAIVFATDVETAGEIARKFSENGIRAHSLSAKTPPTVRENAINEFKSGKCLVLVNVDLFDEGFDVPACDVVIMARPTASLGKYLQMIGRALRYVDGKIALIIDHVSNVKRHKLPDIHRVWSLARKDKRAKKLPDPDDIPMTVCKNCSHPYERFHPICPHCGFAPPLPQSRERTIEQVDGDLVLLDRETLEKMRSATQLESPADVGARVAAVAGGLAAKGVMNKQIEKIHAQANLSEAIAQWAAIQREAGRSDQESYRRFYLAMGTDVLGALSAERTRQDYEEMERIVRGWYAK